MPLIMPRGAETTKTAPVQGTPAPEAPRQQDTVKPDATQEALSPKFAALARREKQLMALDKQIKEREAKMSEREKSYETTHIPKERITKETMKVLMEAGLTRDQVAEMLLAGPTEDPTAFVKQELETIKAQLKASQEKTQTDLQERDKKARDSALNQIRNKATALVDGSADYETIKETGSVEAIVKFIEKTFDEDGIEMSVEEAASFIENELIEEAMKTFELKKIQEKVKAKLNPQPPAEVAKTQPTQKQHQLRTLTNLQGSSTSGRMTEKDRVNRAIMRAKGIDPDSVA